MSRPSLTGPVTSPQMSCMRALVIAALLAAACAAPPVRLLSDRERALAVAVGAARSAEQSTATRISYLVGADGKVKHAYAEVSPGSHAGQVLDDLAADAGR